MRSFVDRISWEGLCEMILSRELNVKKEAIAQKSGEREIQAKTQHVQRS